MSLCDRLIHLFYRQSRKFADLLRNRAQQERRALDAEGKSRGGQPLFFENTRTFSTKNETTFSLFPTLSHHASLVSLLTADLPLDLPSLPFASLCVSLRLSQSLCLSISPNLSSLSSVSHTFSLSLSISLISVNRTYVSPTHSPILSLSLSSLLFSSLLFSLLSLSLSHTHTHSLSHTHTLTHTHTHASSLT